MSKEIYFNNLVYKNEFELLQKIIRIYSIVMLEDDLENHEERVLVFYFKYGYSPDTKEKIKQSLGITAHYLNTINYHLDNKGYLRKDENNKQKKHLTEGLQKMRDAFLKDGSNFYLLKLVKGDGKK
jgi:hypothetical protein